MSKIKRILCFVLSAVLLITFTLSVTVLAADAAEIETEQQLLSLSGAADGEYKLVSDIDLSDVQTDGPLLASFGGTLDGCGYEISGLNIKSDSEAGLIGVLTGTVKNLRVSGDIEIVNNDAVQKVYAGAVAARGSGRVQNCLFSVDITVNASGRAYVGGAAGLCDGMTVYCCTSSGTVNVTGGKSIYAGGIAGAYGNISYCVNNGSVKVSAENADIVYAGGIGGYEADIEFCINNADINAQSTFQAYAGGIGAFFGAEKVTSVRNSENNGAVTAEVKGQGAVSDTAQSRAAAGGIAAYTANTAAVSDTVDESACTSVVSDCKNGGAVSASVKDSDVSAYAGGIAGVVNGLVYNTLNVNDEISAKVCGPVFGAVNPSGKLRGKVKNSFFAQSDAQYNPVIGAEGGTADAVSLSAEQMKSAASFVGFDFEGVWALGENDACPYVIIEDKHEHVYTAQVIPAECEKDAGTVYTCGLCGHSYTEVNEGTATGHAWDDGVVTKEATCVAEGEKLLTCKNDAAHTTTEKIAINPDAHKWGEYVYNNDATEEADGTETRKCEYCDKEETRTAEGTKTQPQYPPVDSSEVFPDIENGRWYKKYVDYVAQYGLMNGMADGTFAPSSNLIRAEFVQILANLSGVDTSNRDVETKFDDVPANKWYTPAVKWASENGIVDGMEPTKFMPSMNVQRQQICVMLVRYANNIGVTLETRVDEMVFADAERIQNYAKEAVVICQKAGIIDGMDDKDGNKIFAPRDTATRAQVAAMITRFHESFVK